MSEPVERIARREEILRMIEEIESHLDQIRELQPAVYKVLDDAFHLGLEPVIRLLLRSSQAPAETASGEPRRETGKVFHLDLRNDDEATRRILYCLTVKDHFLPMQLEDPGDVWVPLVTAKECDLKVHRIDGRWIASWLKLDEPEDRPEAERREFLLLVQDPPGEGPLSYREI